MRLPLLAALASLLVMPTTAAAQARPGAAGIGDPYFPADGNGGYDVAHYGLDLAYTPKSGVLKGVATITATATQDLSRFNLDLRRLKVRAIRIDGRPAHWHHKGSELTVVPRRALRARHRFTAVIRYDGRPRPVSESGLGSDDGWIPTDDGALVAGEPHGASTWFPVNDHPRDKAAYTFTISVPRGTEAIANGVLLGTEERGGRTLWRWDAKEPLASYLATATIGQFQLTTRTVAGLPYIDAIDPDLLAKPQPRTGSRYLAASVAGAGYQRLTRTLEVPASGARLSFWTRRDIEPFKQWFFVEARAAGGDRWTTLADAGRHAMVASAPNCAALVERHPFLTHYLTPEGRVCATRGSTGSWHAAFLPSDRYERWTIDLSRYAGRAVELSLTLAGAEGSRYGGVAIDDLTVTGAPGSTSFEADGDPLDGWTVPGAPAGSAPNASDWVATTGEGAPFGGSVATDAVAQEPEIIAFLSGIFGPYPFSAAGSIIDDELLGFALENQTRPIYSRVFFEDRSDEAPETVIVHELAHQWTGDLLSVRNWRDIWLNEGFATYAEWLWAEHKGRRGAQAELNRELRRLPAGSAFWRLRIGDPGRRHLFDPQVYQRGAMTLQALRTRIGDDAFFRLLKEWVRAHAGGNVATPQFVALAERISGRSLDGFFRAWLYTGRRPSAGSR
jgi:hypothetical protein